MNSIYDNKILVVNDNSTVVEDIKMRMNNAGYHNVDVDDGESAMKMLEKNGYDLLIQDLQRPKQSGSNLYRWMKENDRTANIPIILSTVAMASFLNIVRFTVIGKKKFELTFESFFNDFGQLYVEGYDCLGLCIYDGKIANFDSVEDQAARIFRFWMNCRDPEKERERRNGYLWPAIRQDWR